MDIAKIVALRGTCDRAQVGAVLVNNNRIISIGYNGAPSGKPHCDEVGHKLKNNHCTNAIHAEMNCLEYAPHVTYPRCTLYVTHFPCMDCVIMLLANVRRIAKVVYGIPYGYDDVRVKLLEGGGIRVERFIEDIPADQEH